MKLLASGSIPELLVVLRGEAEAPTKRPAVAVASKPTAAREAGKPALDKPRPLEPPSLVEHRVHPLGGGEVLLLEFPNE